MNNFFPYIKYMSTFINKHKHIIFVTILIIVTLVCIKNFKYIENMTSGNTSSNTNYSNCYSTLSLPPLNISSFKLLNTGGVVPEYYYSCNDNSAIAFYTDGNPTTGSLIYPYDSSDTLLNGITGFDNKLKACLGYSISGQGDFFTISGDRCSSFKIPEVITGEFDVSQTVLINCVDKNSTIDNIPSIKNFINNSNGVDYNKLGIGAFTTKGANKFSSSNAFREVVHNYDPMCNLQIAYNTFSNDISNCLSNTINNIPQTDPNCNQYHTDLSNVINQIINRSGNPSYVSSLDGSACSSINERDCVNAASNEMSTLFGNSVSEFDNSNFRVSDASLSNFDASMDEYRFTLAEENESSLNNKSIFVKYLFLTIVLIITVIIIVLHIVSPSIVTPEILTSYIIFLVIIIFITSNYFNVDYGPLNKFFLLDLGTPGNRNVINKIGYS